MLWTKLFCISLLQTLFGTCSGFHLYQGVGNLQRKFQGLKPPGRPARSWVPWQPQKRWVWHERRMSEMICSLLHGINGMEISRDFHRFFMINDHISAFGGLCNFVPAVQQAARTIVAWWLVVGFRFFFLPCTIRIGILATNQVLWWSLVVRLDKPTITKSGERHFLASCTSKLIHSQWIRTFTLRLCLKIWDPKNHRNS